ncbi:phytanoyl-CoA dioxygenase family protein [Sphingomonas sp. LY29]|uniref:phytanoyl-CoA dioxygenase family protein n=1 Tax=Sphingomonas sp. LY29 TaxID=3095341 RepID=UPI002D79A928|nr:phytanoyl-CoA dioxygenase family protein [Sphingomonas sp. LY29]WRP26598.1 phytanoyl-CoA dioxygenase family protein [Sphingomonas sp. LY29]
MDRGGVMKWWRSPWWLLALLTGAKSFADNPILGSSRLNAAGLHQRRKRLAHVMADRRRAKLASLVPDHLRAEFDRNGFIVVRDVLAPDEFTRLQSDLFGSRLPSRAHQQGDTITRRIPVGPEFLQRFPVLRELIESPRWTGIMAYVASTRSKPLYYIQSVFGGIEQGPPDPQLQLHADTFHPSLKAWLFLTDVGEEDRPLTYVAGSHRFTEARAAWEHAKSVAIHDDANHLSRRGSFRIAPEELADLGLPAPTHFAVPANTLVAIDTSGFHARADSTRPTTRVELWAYCRRTPFLPWTGFDLLSLGPIAFRRAEWLGRAVDWLSARKVMVQHWRPVGLRRPIDP